MTWLQVSSTWYLGRVTCDAWTTLDLVCCTSSIFHLLAISLDRYWAVTQLDYIHRRSPRRIFFMIAASWAGSVVISAPPLFIHHPSTSDPDLTGKCVINQNLVYTVFSTVGAFYLPFALMVVVYIKVFRAARDRIHRKLFRNYARPVTTGQRCATDVSAENSPITTQPLSVTNGDGHVDELELKVHDTETGQRDQVRVAMSGRVSKTCVKKLESTQRLDLLDDNKPFRVRHFSSEVGRALSEVEGLTRHPLCHSELDVLTVKNGTRPVLARSDIGVHRPVTLAASGRDEQPAVSSVPTDTKVSAKPEDSHSSGSERGCPNGRPGKLAAPRSLTGSADVTMVAPVCTVTSPADEQRVARPSNCCVENMTSEAPRLCLPPKAADRLLTPTSTPLHRSSWVDLTRTLLPSAVALRLHFQGTARTAGRTARQLVEQQRERKAARTLAVITGTFVLCWLPFFIIAILRPFCGDHCHYPEPLVSVIVWLGYVNSLLNPIIYTVFNADFRSAFRKILSGKYRSQRR